MNTRTFLKGKILSLLLILLAVSCTTTQNSYRQENTADQKGVWHRIKEGQTLWRIAKTYRISLEEIKKANDIEDVVHIYQGTWIFIPNTTKVLFVQGNILDTKEFCKNPKIFTYLELFNSLYYIFILNIS